MLAADPITFTLDGECFILRPSLRAAIRLERTHGLSGLLKGLDQGSCTIAVNVVQEGLGPANNHFSHNMGLDWLAGPGLHSRLTVAMEACLRFIIELYGLDEKATDEPAPNAPKVTHAEHFTRLYELGTGWLGWSPQTTLDASPSEITAAARGRVGLIGDIMVAMYGKRDGDEPDHNTPAPLEPEPQWKAKLADLSSLGRLG